MIKNNLRNTVLATIKESMHFKRFLDTNSIKTYTINLKRQESNYKGNNGILKAHEDIKCGYYAIKKRYNAPNNYCYLTGIIEITAKHDDDSIETYEIELATDLFDYNTFYKSNVKNIDRLKWFEKQIQNESNFWLV